MAYSKITPFRIRRAGKGKMRPAQHALHLAAVCCLSACGWATTVDGKVINRTTGAPPRSDVVILYSVDRSMHEESRAKTGAHGEFHFDTRGDFLYLVAVRHQNVSYHTWTISGTSQLQIPVYDADTRIERFREDSETLFFDVTPGRLKVTEFFVLSNESDPPKTLVGSNTFRFAIPADSILDSLAVEPPETLPFEIKSWRSRTPGQYRIAYPIRPGVTKVRVKYSVPYSGSFSYQPQVLQPVAAMALMVPESLQLITDQPDIFQQTGKDNGLSVYKAKQLEPGRLPRIWLSSAGTLAIAGASAGETAPASDADLSPPGSLPEASPKERFFAGTTRTVILCFATPVVVIALVIVILMITNSKEVFLQRGEGANTIPSARVGEVRRG